MTNLPLPLNVNGGLQITAHRRAVAARWVRISFESGRTHSGEVERGATMSCADSYCNFSTDPTLNQKAHRVSLPNVLVAYRIVGKDPVLVLQ